MEPNLIPVVFGYAVFPRGTTGNGMREVFTMPDVCDVAISRGHDEVPGLFAPTTKEPHDTATLLVQFVADGATITVTPLREYNPRNGYRRRRRAHTKRSKRS